MTVEFWLKWDNYANDDHLAMEFTDNFNDNAGGFLVDPNAPQLGGSFGVGIGTGDSRNNVFFARPSAGAWHHYAFVLDTAAPAAQQITPYVDGKAGRLHEARQRHRRRQLRQLDALLHVARRPDLFGAGDLDEVAIYNRALAAPTIAKHFDGAYVQPAKRAVAQRRRRRRRRAKKNRAAKQRRARARRRPAASYIAVRSSAPRPAPTTGA